MTSDPLTAGQEAFHAGDYAAALSYFEAAARAGNEAGWQQHDRAAGLAPDFVERLHARPKQRIYIMGCGRSGTTLLLAMMTCFDDTYALIDDAAVPGEDSFGRFARLEEPEHTHVIKRSSEAYRYAHLIPPEIALLYIVRHPLDVFVSTLHYRGKSYNYYIDPERWCYETAAFRALFEQRRPNLFVTTYEALVTSPDAEQLRIGNAFGLQCARPFSRFHESFHASPDIDSTINGLRAPDASSVGRWRDPAHREHLAQIWPRIADHAQWLSNAFGYDLRCS